MSLVWDVLGKNPLSGGKLDLVAFKLSAHPNLKCFDHSVVKDHFHDMPLDNI